jgi:hypothetical protein
MNLNGTGPGYGNTNGSLTDLATPVSPHEEELLVDLLAVNEQLLEALKLYDDLKRIALEREVEKRLGPRVHFRFLYILRASTQCSGCSYDNTSTRTARCTPTW